MYMIASNEYENVIIGLGKPKNNFAKGIYLNNAQEVWHEEVFIDTYIKETTLDLYLNSKNKKSKNRNKFIFNAIKKAITLKNKYKPNFVKIFLLLFAINFLLYFVGLITEPNVEYIKMADSSEKVEINKEGLLKALTKKMQEHELSTELRRNLFNIEGFFTPVPTIDRAYALPLFITATDPKVLVKLELEEITYFHNNIIQKLYPVLVCNNQYYYSLPRNVDWLIHHDRNITPANPKFQVYLQPNSNNIEEWRDRLDCINIEEISLSGVATLEEKPWQSSGGG